MESRKNGNSETSSEENGQSSSPDKSNDESAGTGRSYECTFCKRGFTNAQALGGHMNIHRKDKAKAKAEKNSTKSNKKDYIVMNNNVPSSYFTAVSSDVQGNHNHSSSLEAQMNYQSYFPPSNPSYPQGYNCYYASGYYAHQRTDHFGEYEDHLGANLSLQIGATEMDDSSKGKERDGKENWLENDVDLELRLGYHP